MREQLIQYVALLFAGVADCEDIHQEILQNTLDRYDDLIDQGKVPEAAYRLAISGIGDINEILGTAPRSVPAQPASVPTSEETDTPQKKRMRAFAVGLYILCPLPLFAMSELGAEILGLCGTLVLVAVATVMMILNAKKEEQEQKERKKEDTRSPLQKSVSSMLWAIGLAVYFILSFSTGHWHITWVIFPILGALDNLLMELVQHKEQTGSVHFSSETVSRKTMGKCIWAAGLVIYLIISFATGAWGATWLIFPITGAVKGLVTAILDYKEAVEHET